MNNEIEISSDGTLLVYKKGFTPDFVYSILRKSGLRGLRIFAHLKDELLSNLDFLNEYYFLEELDIDSTNDFDFTFLKSLNSLRKLSIIVDGNNSIDLSNQLYLENLTLQWRKNGIKGLEKCQKLTSLCLIDFKEKDFAHISELIKITDLKIKTSSVESTEGIKDFHIKYLSLGNCNRLTRINDLGSIKSLTSLTIELCSKIEDYSPIGKLFNLEALQIINCKNLETIKFVQNLTSLQRVRLLGNTNVLDGDMNSLKNVKDVQYKKRAHYIE